MGKGYADGNSGEVVEDEPGQWEGEKKHMIPVTLGKVLTQENMGWTVTYVILLNEQRQLALPLWFYQPDEMTGGLSLQTSLRKDLADAALARPLTLDLLTRLLNTLGGTLEGINIDFLQGEVLFAQVYVHDRQQNLHIARARLNDALPLAVQLNNRVMVSEEVLERKGIALTEYGATLEQQLETIAHLMHKNPDLLYLKKEPYNLDFADGLHHWQFLGDPERADYHLDTETTCTGNASLAITLHENQPDTTAMEQPPVAVYINHEGFLAEQYRGQRLRMIATLKTENVQQANLYLKVSGPPVEDTRFSSEQRPGYEHEVNTTAEPLKGTDDWAQHELTIDVAADALTISPYLIVEGEGKLWLDSICFEVMDHHAPLVETH
jgi:bifunctional DNase/RNase